jgi:hypothetical protein
MVALAVVGLALAVACGPLGSDDGESGGDSNGSGNQEQRTVVMATFTATIPGSTPETVLTQGARQTVVAMTATTTTGTPPILSTIPEGYPTPTEYLSPPEATLTDGNDTITATYGSYSWQFDDRDQTFARISATLMEVSDVALTLSAGSDLTLTIHDIITLPQAVQLSAYQYEANTAIPIDASGNVVSDKPAFAPKEPADKYLNIAVDPANPTFSLDLPPDHYVLLVQAAWGNHPVLTSEPIFITYVFNVIVE